MEENQDAQAATLAKYWARQPKSTGEMVSMMDQHYQLMQERMQQVRNDRFLGIVAEKSAQMREALVSAGIQPEKSVIGGEQSGLVFPANIEKSIIGAALTYMTGGEITYIGLRANWDIVRSQSDMYRDDMPRAGSKDGFVPVSLLTRSTFGYGEVSAGIPNPNPDLSTKMGEFREAVKQSYPGDLQGEVLKELDIFMACMGYAVNKQNGEVERLNNLPWFLEEPITGSTIREVPTTFEQLRRVTPTTFAAGLENYFLYLTEKLDIHSPVPVSEGVIDKFLLANGGYDLLRATWEASMQKLNQASQRAVDPFVPVTLGKRLTENGMTFFNISTGPRKVTINDDSSISIDGAVGWSVEIIEDETLSKKGYVALVGPDGDRVAVDSAQLQAGNTFDVAGIRYETRFDPMDSDYIIAFNPKTKGEAFRIHVADALDVSSKWKVSLTAVARVVIYNLAGLGGHVVGSAAYNADAAAVSEVMGVPYFPTFATKLGPDGKKKPESMINYVSLSVQKDQAKLDRLEREIQHIKATEGNNTELLRKKVQERDRIAESVARVQQITIKGGLSITDFQFSVALEGARALIAEHLRLTGGNINTTHQMRFANRAGRMAK